MQDINSDKTGVTAKEKEVEPLHNIMKDIDKGGQQSSMSMLPLSMRMWMPFHNSTCLDCGIDRKSGSSKRFTAIEREQIRKSSSSVPGGVMMNEDIDRQQLLCLSTGQLNPPPMMDVSATTIVNTFHQSSSTLRRRKQQSSSASSNKENSTNNQTTEVVAPQLMSMQQSFSFGEKSSASAIANALDESTSSSSYGNIKTCLTAVQDFYAPSPSMSLSQHNSSRNLQPGQLQYLRCSPPEIVEELVQDYLAACNLYSCTPNSGVLTTIRFSLPTMRVGADFHDADMLALAELLIHHCNHALGHVKRLDFRFATKRGRLHGQLGFNSHGAFSLSKVLQISKYIEEVYLHRNRLGPYGSSTIFLAASQNSTLKVLGLRRCLVGERGAKAFAMYIATSDKCGLRTVDLSTNRIGFDGSKAIADALVQRKLEGRIDMQVNMDGNLVFQEVMNCVTHGLGIILCIIGTTLLNARVQNQPASMVKLVSCGVYSASLLTLYTSSVLFHSFFALQKTRRIFAIIDKCAIYILIAGSYTPYLQISLQHKPIWSFGLLAFIWTCCIGGISVDVFYSDWVYKKEFSLAMYLGMGWSCMICAPALTESMPQEAVNLIILGGVCYTGGVTFFVRNNNLDHAIWHCFVLAGSICHWFGIYSYVLFI